MRRASHDALTKAVVQRYYPIQTKEANILVTSLLTNPKDRNQHFLRAGASTIMAILYDYPTLPSAHERAIEEIGNSVQQSARAASLGSTLVEFLPWMLHIPQRYETPLKKIQTLFTSAASLGLRNGKENRWNNPPNAPRFISDYLMVSEPAWCVLR
jgi:hypothetical protein